MTTKLQTWNAKTYHATKTNRRLWFIRTIWHYRSLTLLLWYYYYYLLTLSHCMSRIRCKQRDHRPPCKRGYECQRLRSTYGLASCLGMAS